MVCSVQLVPFVLRCLLLDRQRQSWVWILHVCPLLSHIAASDCYLISCVIQENQNQELLLLWYMWNVLMWKQTDPFVAWTARYFACMCFGLVFFCSNISAHCLKCSAPWPIWWYSPFTCMLPPVVGDAHCARTVSTRWTFQDLLLVSVIKKVSGLCHYYWVSLLMRTGWKSGVKPATGWGTEEGGHISNHYLPC